MEQDENPEIEPECSHFSDTEDESEIECEFNFNNGQWWCTTHNCPA